MAVDGAVARQLSLWRPNGTNDDTDKNIVLLDPLSVNSPSPLPLLDEAHHHHQENHLRHPLSTTSFRISLPEALREVLALLGPTFLSYGTGNLIGVSSIVAVGRIGSPEMQAGFAMANTLANVFGLTVGFGLASGLDTLCPQALGNQRKDLCLNHFVKAILVLTMAFLPQIFIVWTSGLILRAIHQPAAIAMYAEDSLRSYAVGIYAIYIFECCRKFLVHCGSSDVVAMISVLQVPVHWFFLWILMFKLRVAAPTAAGMSGSLSNCFSVCLALIYIWRNREKFEWSRFKAEQANYGLYAFFTRQVGEIVVFLRIAVPSALYMFTEWIAVEAQMFQCAYIGAVELAAFSMADGLASMLFMMSIGLSVSLSSLVGNSIGAGKVADAVTYTRAGLWICLTVSISTSAFVLLTRSALSAAFTASPSVQMLLKANLLLVPFICIFDGVQESLGGVVRGLGLQAKAIWANGVCLGVVMQVVGAYSAFVLGYGGRGLLFGSAVGLFLVTIWLGTLIWTVDWHQCRVDIGDKPSQGMENQEDIECDDFASTAC